MEAEADVYDQRRNNTGFQGWEAEKKKRVVV